MTDNYIQLKKSNKLVLGIKDENNNDTGNVLEFDLEDIELALRYQEMLEKDKKNKEWAQKQMVIIDKRQDVSGKKLLSKNEEDKLKVLNEFFKKEAEIYNIFLGKNGVQKLLNGEKLGWTSLSLIDEYIDEQILPHLDITKKRITEQVKEKYTNAIKRNEEVLK